MMELPNNSPNALVPDEGSYDTDLSQKIEAEVKLVERDGHPYFTMHLPYDDERRVKRGYRAQMRHIEAWDITLGEWISKNSTYDGKDIGRSQKALNQTPREFYETFDKILTEEGIDFEEARKCLRQLEKGGMTSRERSEFHKKLGPVYRKLRQKGYSETDLTTY